MRYLHQSYSTFIPNYDNQRASLPSMFEEFHSLDFWGERINSRKHSYCIIVANWMKNGGQINCKGTNNSRAGIVNYFFRQNVMTHSGRLVVVMAFVNWLQLHPHRHILGHPVELWCYEPFGPASFIPVQRIKSLCCSCNFDNSDDKTLLATVPLHHKINY